MTGEAEGESLSALEQQRENIKQRLQAAIDDLPADKRSDAITVLGKWESYVKSSAGTAKSLGAGPDEIKAVKRANETFYREVSSVIDWLK